MNIQRNPTRAVRIGSVTIGAGQPIAVQSMTATHTHDVDATVAPGQRPGGRRRRRRADRRRQPDGRRGAGRNPPPDRGQPVVDLQENYRLAEQVAPHVDKIRYNPGHLVSPRAQEAVAGQGALSGRRRRRQRLRDPRRRELRLRRSGQAGRVRRRPTRLSPMLDSALEHCELLDELGFTRYCVSLKDSDPQR